MSLEFPQVAVALTQLDFKLIARKIERTAAIFAEDVVPKLRIWQPRNRAVNGTLNYPVRHKVVIMDSNLCSAHRGYPDRVDDGGA